MTHILGSFLFVRSLLSPVLREQLFRSDPAFFDPEILAVFQMPVHAGERVRIHSRCAEGVVQLLHGPENRLFLGILSSLFAGHQISVFVRGHVQFHGR